jgi:hypothetical protein
MSTLKDNGHRKNMEQRKEKSIGRTSSFVVCDLVYKGGKLALTVYSTTLKV